MAKQSHAAEAQIARAALAPASQQSATARGPCSVSSATNLETELAALDRLTVDELRTRWRNRWGRLAPAHLSRALLVKILAYRLQAEAFGDLDRKTVRMLERLADSIAEESSADKTTPSDKVHSEVAESQRPPTASDSQTGSRRPSEPVILKPGTLLTREWQGRMETVMVIQDGYAWNGRAFSSLTAVALAMTGTKWSGARFFGVRPQDRVSPAGAKPPPDRGQVRVPVAESVRGRDSRQSQRHGNGWVSGAPSTPDRGAARRSPSRMGNPAGGRK
jgi:DUF2924 family protein